MRDFGFAHLSVLLNVEPFETVISPLVHEIKPVSERNYPYYATDENHHDDNMMGNENNIRKAVYIITS